MKRRHTFKKKDYSSGDGFLVSIWGPCIWFFLHMISFNYPIHPNLEQKRGYLGFIQSLVYVLPCRHCRENLKKNFEKDPFTMKDMENRDTFSRKMYDLHENINKMLGKPSTVQYTELREMHENFRSRCTLDDISKLNLPLLKRKRKTEKGCTEPLYGKKAKCLIKIVPQTHKAKTIEIHKSCVKTRKNKK